MSYSIIPDLLLYGLLNIHSLRQTKYFFIPQVKDIAHTCKQTPELTHFMPEYYCTQKDIL